MNHGTNLVVTIATLLGASCDPNEEGAPIGRPQDAVLKAADEAMQKAMEHIRGIDTCLDEEGIFAPNLRISIDAFHFALNTVWDKLGCDERTLFSATSLALVNAADEEARDVFGRAIAALQA